MKRLFLLMLIGIMTVTAITGCAKKNEGDKEVLQSPVIEEDGDEDKVDETKIEEEESKWPRTYVDALGHEVVIEKEPIKVISIMHALYPDVLFALDTPPIGVTFADTSLNKWEAFLSYTQKHQVIDVGATRSPNLELMLEMEPDLIIAASGIHDQLYDQLSAISNVVYIDQGIARLDRAFGVREIAKLLGKEEQGEAVLNNLNQKIADSNEKLADFKASGETVVVCSVGDKGFWLYPKNIVVYGNENGFGLAAPEGYPENSQEQLTIEGMALFNPDHIFILTEKGNQADEEGIKALEANSLYNKIKAVENNQVYEIDLSAFAMDAPIGTDFGIDEVLRYLLD